MDRTQHYTRQLTVVLLSIIFFCIAPLQLEAQFQQIHNIGALGDKKAQDGGHAWGDVNHDGYPDVIIHIGNGGSGVKAKLFVNSGPPNFTFADVTSTHIAGFNDGIAWGRQMLIVDFNNDGYNDILRGCGGGNVIEIYYNNGPPIYDFGNSSQQPDVTINNMPDGREFNVEGVGAIDWNQDGWLDLIIDNDGGGNDIFENDRSGGFNYINPGTASGETGFPSHHSGDGDYLTVADVNNDGYVDFYGRKTSVTNYWRFDPSISHFVNQANPNIVSSEGDKGGTMFCDFDNDGDLDLFWTSHGTNQIWLYDGKNGLGNDIWTPTGLPGGSIATQTGIDGCDCGDVDNDGDLDIVLGASSGSSYLLVNQLKQSGSLAFNSQNIATNEDTESLSLTDYDADGDLDLYFVVNGDSNQLWQNTTNNSDFFYVNAMFDNGNGTSRAAIGANVILTDCGGNSSGMRQVNGAKGHGSQHQTKIHFGVDPDAAYVVNVYYIYENGSRAIVRKRVVPSQMANQTITILDTDANDITGCTDQDADLITDLFDVDDDNDGIPDMMEICGNGANDFSCLDYILHDGSNNGIDPTGDEDVDGIPNFRDADDLVVFHAVCVDNNLDGYCDQIPFIFDPDGDGIPSFWDLDSDNDGIPDIIEAGGTDTDGDGIADTMKDSDRDGIQANADANTAGCSGDTSPADGICDAAQGGTDTDGDGIQDADDRDADGDGWADLYDNSGSSSGINLTVSDKDGDGIADFLDLDSDNDGIPDIIEAGGYDSDGNGIADNLTDSDGDGLVNIFDPLDDGQFMGTGNTGSPHFTTGADSGNGTPITPCMTCDLDGDGIPNHLDLDADGDGILDVVEAGGTDSDNDGKADGTVGTDGYNNGLNPDGGGNPLITVNTDSAGDSDNRPEYIAGTGTGDSDGDDVPDFLDVDADNDGIFDNYEAQTTSGYIAPLGSDSDKDGIDDAYDADEVSVATNGIIPNNHDGVDNPDYLDLDTDNDNIPDIQEAWDHMYDGDTQEDNISNCNGNDNDGDGLLDCFDDDDNDLNSYDWAADPADDIDGANGVAAGTLFADNLDVLLPDNGGLDANQPDYRDAIQDCNSSKVYYAITENGGTPTNYEYNGSMHIDGANTKVTRATVYCIHGDWHYYYNPLEPGNYLFAIRNSSGSPNTMEMYELVNFIEIKVESNPLNRIVKAATGATLVMERDWRVEFKKTPPAGSTFDIRFYFDPQELRDIGSAADLIGLLGIGAVQQNLQWFKKPTGLLNSDITSLGVDDMTDITNVATEVFSKASGVSNRGASYSKDGSTANFGNGKNFVQFNGLSSFSGGTGMINMSYAALPIELSEFEARTDGCNIDLNWTTVTEIRASHFELERSSDGRNFKSIKTINTSGGLDQGYSYHFTDVQTLPANYYRLKMIDLDGSFEYSRVLFEKTNCFGTKKEITVYPNPMLTASEGILTVKLFSTVQQVKIYVQDVNGQIVRMMVLPSEIGENTVRINVHDLPTGHYFITCEIDGVKNSQKFIRYNED